MSQNTNWSFKYVGKDYKNMSDEKQKTTIVRCGSIDVGKVFKFLNEREANAEEVDMTKIALKEVDKISRCHHDILAVEFGKKETTVAELVQVSDVIFQYPPDVCINKLNQALETVQFCLHKIGMSLEAAQATMRQITQTKAEEG